MWRRRRWCGAIDDRAEGARRRRGGVSAGGGAEATGEFVRSRELSDSPVNGWTAHAESDRTANVVSWAHPTTRYPPAE